jgi:multidrug efflux pump subunit AcrA (membrane-fusion protein)
MKIRQQGFKFAALIIISVLAGCGTISFFPTAPAQKAADKVIEDIWPPAQPTVPVVAVGTAKEKEPPPGPVISPKPETK